MTEQVVDHAERLRALDPGGSFIVQAPAGAGKTELLVRRFLTLLGQVTEPEEIVAITFTRKAAAEMRDRIITAMRGAEAGPPDDPAAASARRQLASRAVARDRERGWRLLDHPARLRIQTIDSLCASLTRQMPWLSRFGAPMEIIEDADPLYREAALDTLRLLDGGERQWAGAVFSVLEHLDNRVDRALDLLTTMLGRREQWLRHLGKPTDDGSWRRELQGAWEQVVVRELQAARAAVPSKLLEPIAACARYAAENLAQRDPASPVIAWGDTLEWPAAQAISLSRWQALAGLWLTGKDQWFKKLNVRNGFPADHSQRAQTMKRQAAEVLEALSANDDLRRALSRIRALPAPAFQDRQWRVLGALTLLCRLAAARLHSLFAERGQADFAELGRRASNALGNSEAPSELALRLDYRIQHLLVDEFQDTSESQRRLLEQLTAGWAEGDGHSLFLVGDPMQSIYRFREAEVGIFLQVAERGLGSLRLELVRLQANFRSDRAVVGWVNDVFQDVLPDRSDPMRGAVRYARAVPQVAPVADARVEVHAMIDADADDEASRVVELIREHGRERALGGVAILVRARAHLQRITPALARAGVPYASIDLGGLASQPVVQDLLALLQALSHPADRLSWLAVLRAPWCGLCLDDLLAVSEAAADACVWDVLRQRDSWPALSARGADALARCVGVLERAMQRRGRMALRTLVEATWEQLGGPACVGPGALVDAGQLLDLVSSHDSGGRLPDLGAFHNALTARWSRSLPVSEDAVQVMTLHKAKGLEFDSVIIPGLHRGTVRDDPRLLAWQEDVLGDGLLLAPLHETGAGDDPHYSYLRDLEKDKQRLESQRLIYVGCTRAVRQLHLLGSVKRAGDGSLGNPPRGSLLAMIWPRVKSEFEAAAGQAAPSDKAVVDRQARSTGRLPDGWQPPPRATSPITVLSAPVSAAERVDIEFSWAGHAARAVGVLAHEVLQHVGEQGLEAWDGARLHRLASYWRLRLCALGVAEAELQPALERLRTALEHVLADPRARWLFDPAHRSAHNEFPVTFVDAGRPRRLRIDRTFVDGVVRWIVDFKTSTHEGADVEGFLDSELERYRPQLLRYAAAMQALEPQRIRLGLYFPLLRGWRECETEES